MRDHLKQVNVLLVEDALIIQSCVKTILEGLDCIVSVASSYSEALEKFTISFDGILTDIGLPDGSGSDFIAWIFHHYPAYKAIIYVYSAFPDEYVAEKISHLPIDGQFSKPFLYNDVKNFVDAVHMKKRMVL